MNLMKLFNTMDEAFGEQSFFVGLTYHFDHGYVTVDVLEEDVFLINYVPFAEDAEAEYFEAKGLAQFMFIMNSEILQKVGK